MTDLTMILPVARNPLHPPRRDLVVSSADCLSLRVTIVESDDPSAQALVLTGGIGGPVARLVVWAEGPGTSWDYGRSAARVQQTLWSGDGVLSDAIGSFDIHIPAATMANWPVRCGWSVHLDWDGGGSAQMLAEGYLHVRRTAQIIIAPRILLDDDGQPILLDGTTRDFSVADFAAADFV